VEQQDVERIARTTLKDLGVSAAWLTIAPAESRPGQWRIDVAGTRPARLTITCSDGSTPAWVRSQILEQYLAQT